MFKTPNHQNLILPDICPQHRDIFLNRMTNSSDAQVIIVNINTAILDKYGQNDCALDPKKSTVVLSIFCQNRTIFTAPNSNQTQSNSIDLKRTLTELLANSKRTLTELLPNSYRTLSELAKSSLRVR